MQYIFLFWHVHAELAFGFTFFLFLIDKNHSVRYLFGNYFVRDHSDSINNIRKRSETRDQSRNKLNCAILVTCMCTIFFAIF